LLKPLPHQTEAIAYMHAHKWVLCSMGMGMGKTGAAILAWRALGGKLLVVSPAFLKSTWAAEIGKWLSGVSVAICEGKTVPRTLEADVTILNYEILEKAKHLFKYADIVVADELHYVKNRKAKRTVLVYELLKKHRPAHFWGLTGTPIKNRIPEFWSLLRILSLCPGGENGLSVDLYRGYWKFCEHFCHMEMKRIGRMQIRQYVGFRNVADLKALLKDKYFRRTFKDLTVKLPPETNTSLAMGKLKAEKGLEGILADYELGKVADTATPAKVECALEKVKHTITWVKDAVEQGVDALLVLTDYVSVAEAIAREVQGAVLLTGRQSPKARWAACQEFQANGGILVCTIGAVKEGLTLTRANHAVFNDLCYVPGDLAQVKRRIRRIGQEKTCHYYYVTGGEVDSKITEMIREKTKILLQALGE
jgi:SNF2 family DNA or RNA helicase